MRSDSLPFLGIYMTYVFHRMWTLRLSNLDPLMEKLNPSRCVPNVNVVVVLY